MKSSPLISVIIPVYNGKNFIKNCLNIITHQSYKNLEVIVVDDGSTDNSIKIIEQFPFKLVKHKTNKGLSEARNSGLDIATGKYIHFMDIDDEINNTFYENLLHAIETTKADIACSGIIHQKSKGKTQLFTKQREHKTLNEKLKATYVGKRGYVWRYLFSLTFLKENNLRFEKGRLIEDLPFSFAAFFFANKIVTVPGAEYLYVFNSDSIMNTDNEKAKQKRRQDKKYAKNFVLDFAKKHGNFKVPGVNVGTIKYIFTKIVTSLSNPRRTLN